MSKEIEVVDKKKVFMSNQLARAAQGLTLSEKRIIALGLSNEDSKSPARLMEASTSDGWQIEINALDYASAFNLDPNTAYDQLRSAGKKLTRRLIVWTEKNKRGKEEENEAPWVRRSTYVAGEGCIRIRFSPEVAPHLLGLATHFTSYRLKHAAAFESIYAWRLYEVLQSWKSTGVYTTSIEDFWGVMEAPPSCRKDFKGLRCRVIEPSVAAIQQHAGLKIDWQPLRSGSRRVTALEFRFGPDPQGKLDLGERVETGNSDVLLISPTNP